MTSHSSFCAARWHGGGRDGGRLDPAGMNPAGQAFRVFGIRRALQQEAAEGGLDMIGRAAEPVIKLQMTEGCIEVVAPEQADHQPASPDAFGLSCHTAQKPIRFGEFFLLTVFGGVRRRRLIGRPDLSALSIDPWS